MDNLKWNKITCRSNKETYVLVIVMVESVHVVVALSVAAVSVPNVVVSATAAVIMRYYAVHSFFHLDLFHHGGNNRFIGRQ